MAVIYNDYTRARIGWFMGMTGGQLAVVGGGLLPVLWAFQRQAWAAMLMLALAWLVVAFVTLVPVKGRSALGWALAVTGYALGTLAGWTRFRSAAATGQASPPGQVDLPGVLAGIEVHEGPPLGAGFSGRAAIIQNHQERTWAVTAALVHPGIGLVDAPERAQYGAGLSDLLDIASRGELIAQLTFLTRTVPDDGAEREQYLRRRRAPAAPAPVRQITGDLGRHLTGAGVRTEAFVTLVVPEARLAKGARESGGGIEGRARVLYALMNEVEAQLRGGMGMSSVSWLTSPELALACRTGFAPGDRAAVVEALAQQDRQGGIHTDVPWALAGPSGSEPAPRYYSHDAWNSISCTVLLPDKGAAMGAIRPILTPTQPGERRSYAVTYPIAKQASADRRSANSAWLADVSEELRAKAGVRQRERSARESARARDLDVKLAQGNAMTEPYAVCTVTVPKSERVGEYGRALDAAIRRAGFAPLRLDLSQDAAFAASTIPLGTALTRAGLR